MSRLGIVAAFPGELRPLVHGVKPSWRILQEHSGTEGDTVWEGRIGEMECFAVAAGMGSQAAERACGVLDSLAAQHGGLSGLVSLGWAGALSCGLRVGRAYWVAEVVDAGAGERFAAKIASDLKPRLTLVTIDHVAQSPEKRTLAQSYLAVLVDMEAAVVARFAASRGIPFSCLKAVSDAPGDMLPDFGRYTDSQGKLRIARLLAGVAFQPKYWRPMARLGKNSKAGAQALAEMMRAFG